MIGSPSLFSFAAMSASGVAVGVHISNDGGWQVDFGGVGWSGVLPYPIGRDGYHVIELIYDVASAGYCAVILDGYLIWENTGNTSGREITSVVVGNRWGGVCNGDYYIGSILVDDATNPPNPPPPPPLADITFETSDLSQFFRVDIEHGLMEVTTDYVHSGNFGCRVYNDGLSNGIAHGVSKFTATPNIHAQLHMLIPSTFNVGSNVYPFLILRQDGTRIISLRLSSTGLVLELIKTIGDKVYTVQHAPRNDSDIGVPSVLMPSSSNTVTPSTTSLKFPLSREA